MVVVSVGDNSCKIKSIEVCLFDLKEIRRCIKHIPSQVLWAHHVLGEVCKLWSHDIVQGETLYPIMSGQVILKIANML